MPGQVPWVRVLGTLYALQRPWRAVEEFKQGHVIILLCADLVWLQMIDSRE